MKWAAVIDKRNLLRRDAKDFSYFPDCELANADDMGQRVKLVRASLSRKSVPSAKPFGISEYGHVMHGGNSRDWTRGRRKQNSRYVVKIRWGFSKHSRGEEFGPPHLPVQSFQGPLGLRVIKVFYWPSQFGDFETSGLVPP